MSPGIIKCHMKDRKEREQRKKERKKMDVGVKA